MQNSVSLPTLDPRAVSGTTEGAIDMFDYVDAVQGLFARIGPPRVPRGAPVLISGWAVDPTCDVPPSAVAVVLDAMTIHAAETGLSRYDVKARLGVQTPEMIGFRALVPTDHVPAGDHALVAYALAADGAWYEAASRRFRLYARMLPELAVVSRRTRVNLDVIGALAAAGERGTIPGVVPHGQFALVRGWAADLETQQAVAGVCAIDDRGGRWTAPCDIARPDVREAVGGVDDRFGFEIPIPTEGLERGVHTVEVWAFDDRGARLGRPEAGTYEVAMPMRLFPPFADVLAMPAVAQVAVRVSGPGADDALTMLRPDRSIAVARGDVLELEGWAVLPGDVPGAQIVLEMHPLDLDVPPTRFHPVAGYRRKKPPREFESPPCEDAWFSYRLGTLLLSPYTYRLTVAVVADGGYRFARADLGTVRVVGPDPREPVSRA